MDPSQVVDIDDCGMGGVWSGAASGKAPPRIAMVQTRFGMLAPRESLRFIQPRKIRRRLLAECASKED